jgi:hypothetical protein
MILSIKLLFLSALFILAGYSVRYLAKAAPFIILLLLVLSGCSSSKKVQNFSHNKIIFGYEGGIVGSVTEYALQYNGIVQKYNSLTKETTLRTKIPRQKSEQLFRRFLKYGLDTMNYSVPGNMSQFLGFKNDSVTHKIIWNNSSLPPAKVVTLYNDLIQLVRNQ